MPATLSPLTCECPHSESTEPCKVHRELAIDRLPRFLIPPQRICRNCKNKDGGCVALSVFQLRGQTQTGPRLCFLFPHDMETNILLMSLLCGEREVLLGANTKGRTRSQCLDTEEQSGSCLPSVGQDYILHLYFTTFTWRLHSSLMYFTQLRSRLRCLLKTEIYSGCLYDVFLVSPSSVPAAPQHVRRSELHRHVADDRLLRLLCCHLPWSQGKLEYIYSGRYFLMDLS